MYMLAAGTAGETQREILDVLNFQEDNDPETPFKVRFANKNIFTDCFG
jgi:hypothetical protein